MLEVKDLSVSYGGIRALREINFKIDKGQIVTLIGANGAGKSTTLRAISGLVPKKGKIIFEGKDITSLPSHEIVALGISHVPEGRRIFSTLTVMENLELAGWTRKDKKAIKGDMDYVFTVFPRLKERINQLAGTLSGGEQQMLAMARALITKGSLVLLDEPSMGLSPVLVDEVFEVIKKINRFGTTILLVEQNARMALEYANYAYLLEVGSIVTEGSCANLINDPKVKEAYLGG